MIKKRDSAQKKKENMEKIIELVTKAVSHCDPPDNLKLSIFSLANKVQLSDDERKLNIAIGIVSGISNLIQGKNALSEGEMVYLRDFIKSFEIHNRDLLRAKADLKLLGLLFP